MPLRTEQVYLLVLFHNPELNNCPHFIKDSSLWLLVSSPNNKSLQNLMLCAL